MKRGILVVMIMMVFSLVVACGGGGGGGEVGPDLAAFLGIWFGPGDDRNDAPFPVELTMDGSGGISDYKTDGSSEPGVLPASFVVEDDSSARITFDDMTEGGLFWDDAVEHLLFVDPTVNIFAVVEKNAAALPAYAVSDAAGSWAGYVYADDGAGDFEKLSPVLLTVANDLSFSGTDPTNNTFSGSFNAALFDSTHGMYIGTVDGPPAEESIRIFLSPDMNFSGGILWEVGDVWPDDYLFLVLTRQ